MIVADCLMLFLAFIASLVLRCTNQVLLNMNGQTEPTGKVPVLSPHCDVDVPLRADIVLTDNKQCSRPVFVVKILSVNSGVRTTISIYGKYDGGIVYNNEGRDDN